MEENQLVECMKDLIDAHEFREKNLKQFESELEMWRTRYLNSLPLHKEKEKSAAVWIYFLHAAPDHMVRRGPEQCLKDIEYSLKGFSHENK